MNPAALNALLLYCRAGFENDCAGEICARAARHDAAGYAKTTLDSGYVVFHPHEAAALADAWGELRLDSLIFARQLVWVTGLVSDLPIGDRTGPLLDAARRFGTRFSDVWLETADTNEAKEVSGFCRKFAKPLAAELLRAGLAGDDARLPRLHVFFLGSAAAWVGVTDPALAAPWPMGILRLKMPGSAPSRSTLKLAEAFKVFDIEPRLRAGQTAVDLGAAPGGWSWQFARREIHVTAVDNGAMDKALLATSLVEHLRADAFHWRPKASQMKCVDWLVCDMIEKPSRIATLIAEWIAAGLAREAIFNLKLPMKKRREEVGRCIDLIDDRLDAARIKYRLRCKQLYHDREEITCHLRT